MDDSRFKVSLEGKRPKRLNEFLRYRVDSNLIIFYRNSRGFLKNNDTQGIKSEIK